MTDKVLIVGYGRAGRRHESVANAFGLKVFTADPLAKADYHSLGDAAMDHDFDIVIIATPPRTHISLSLFALIRGAWVLCEKPLCENRQINEAKGMRANQPLFVNRLAIAYNYRFHPSLTAMAYSRYHEKFNHGNSWAIYCKQSRVLPEWGLLLDHVSHDVDILRDQTERYYGQSSKIIVTEVMHHKSLGIERYRIIGKIENVDNVNFLIDETVTDDPSVDRQAVICSPFGCLDITPNPAMHIAMWQDFLDARAGKGKRSLRFHLSSAISTQEILRDIEDKSNFLS